jgi:hypothetical protein
VDGHYVEGAESVSGAALQKSAHING